MNVLVSGLVNVETSVKVRKFPIEYYPSDYPFFGVDSHIAGVAYNLAKALTTLGDDVDLLSFRGEDEEGNRIEREMRRDDISVHLFHSLKQTPVSVVLYDDDGRRQIYCDLKDIQEKQLQEENYEELLAKCDVVAACNISFNRPLLRRAKELGKMIATDVHVLSDIRDEYNQDFLRAADILFLSDEGLPCAPEVFLDQLSTAYPFKIGVIGLGSKGAMLYDREKDEIYHLEPQKRNMWSILWAQEMPCFRRLSTFLVKEWRRSRPWSALRFLPQKRFHSVVPRWDFPVKLKWKKPGGIQITIQK